MATSGRGSGVAGYDVQVAVDTDHHLIITPEVTNVGSDRAQLADMAKRTKAMLELESLDVVADRGYYSSEGLACENEGVTVTYNAGSTNIRRRCASGGRRSSICSAQSKPAWVPRTF